MGNKKRGVFQPHVFCNLKKVRKKINAASTEFVNELSLSAIKSPSPVASLVNPRNVLPMAKRNHEASTFGWGSSQLSFIWEKPAITIPIEAAIVPAVLPALSHTTIHSIVAMKVYLSSLVHVRSPFLYKYIATDVEPPAKRERTIHQRPP